MSLPIDRPRGKVAINWARFEAMCQETADRAAEAHAAATFLLKHNLLTSGEYNRVYDRIVALPPSAASPPPPT